MRVEKDYEDLLGFLNKNRVRYCIIGAFAFGFHARPRYTKDIDILVEPTVLNARRILKALVDFGFGSLRLSESDFANEGNIIQLGVEPVRIDLLTSLAGLPFKQIWKNKSRGRYGKHEVHFLGREDLIQSKRIADRPKDRVDIDVLRRQGR